MCERKFKVILKKSNVAYPDMTGDKALACMVAFEGRFIETVAITSANGINECLTLVQMRDIYGSDEATEVAQ